MYIIRKAMEYFKPKINRAYMNEALKRLSENEKKYFWKCQIMINFIRLKFIKK